MSDSQAPVTAPPDAHAIWPPEKLCGELVSPDLLARQTALAMCAQPGAPVDDCIDALLRCAEQAGDDALQLQTVAVVLGGATPACVSVPALELISALTEARYADPVRIFAAHAMLRLKLVPASTFARLAAMLVHAEANVRQIALAALSPVIKQAAGAITQLVAALPPERWTTEALTALARSAGDSPAHRNAVEQHIMRLLPAAPIIPTGIAGYTALAHMQPAGAATVVLARVAATATDPQHWKAALQALTTLGEAGQAAASELGRALVEMVDPEREEATCRALAGVRAKEKDVPLPTMMARIQAGPERSAAAHCMLLCLHAKAFAPAAKVVRERYAVASAALRPALSQTHLALAGTKLDGVPAARS
jgi:hypothetical protein